MTEPAEEIADRAIRNYSITVIGYDNEKPDPKQLPPSVLLRHVQERIERRAWMQRTLGPMWLAVFAALVGYGLTTWGPLLTKRLGLQ